MSQRIASNRPGKGTTGRRKDESAGEIAASLRQQATELWGPHRASEIRDVIEEMANAIWRIQRGPPPAEEEPGFYL